ncbi:hypothetical protein [Methylogaea oryzae]|uniref:hypothetical protein n=1 Tax=Methylogaea oryzae TaxID=1295382 RepID=UPI0012E2BC14|nr:hypothetical protein [Methylogaea oryzae]
MEQARWGEFLKRLRIAVSALTGFLAGKWLAQSMGHHESEFFIGGFLLGSAAIQLLYLAAGKLRRKSPAP